jgi:serine/threonine protein kinase/Tfp pilus assembly protein PilF
MGESVERRPGMTQATDTAGKASRAKRDWDAGADEPSFVAARSIKRKLLAELCGPGDGKSPVRPEEVLPRWPTDPKDDPDVASLLFEDFRQRCSRGEQPSIAEYEERFPEHKDSVANLLHRHDFLRSVTGGSACSGPPLALPSVGDELFGFRLRRELGSGAFARVFLAEEANLAGRLVVLKTSDTNGQEPQTLAQLQHTHIMPIHSVHEDAQAGLRAVCMPYFGGASLSCVLKTLWSEETPPVTGQQFVQALAAVGSERELRVDRSGRPSGNDAPSEKRLESGQAGTHNEETTGLGEDTERTRNVNSSVSAPALRLLSSYTYVQAAAWIVARLAEGLQHAHDRGILHRDIKPSNILVGADGQPLLLDFNLAYNVNADQAQAEATLGGTVAYMAPEHLRALASRDLNQARLVDQRSDIYALGMVLYEMLTGHNPFDQSGSYSPMPVLMEAMAVERSRSAPSLRQRRPDVPWSLESIARKCMAPAQEQRYQQAEHVAEDLKRFLEDRPLQYAPELSRREQLRKWVRQHPRLTSSGSVATLAILLLIAAGFALAGVREHLAHTQAQLADTQAQELKRAYDEDYLHALCLLNTTADGQDHLEKGLEVCEKALARYGVLTDADWQHQPDWQRLDRNERRELAEETRELLLLLAGARVRKSPMDHTVLREALMLLDRAEAIADLEPSPALARDHATYYELLGDTTAAREARARAKQIQPSSARDYYQLATTFIREGGLANQRKAVAALDKAIDRNDRHYWSYFQRGMCYKELGEYTLAGDDFSTCIGLWPEFAWAYFNRGYVLHQIGRKEQACADYTAALERDPQFVNAYLNRGLVQLELRQFAAALADYDQAAALGRDDASVYAGRGIALEGLGRPQEADAAFDLAFARMETAPAKVRSQIRWTYGFAVAARLPEKARQAFNLVLQENPNHPQALYGCGMLRAAQNRPEEALHYFNQAIQVSPQFVEPRRARAILLARRGSIDSAVQDINWCLEREPQSGSVLYGAACVLALAAGPTTDAAGHVSNVPSQVANQLTDQALRFLKAALDHGYGKEKAAKDPDLFSLRSQPEFQRVTRDE